MAAIELYNFELDDNCYKVRLLLSILALKHVTHAVDMVPGNEHLGPAILALNPTGNLPILKDGELVLFSTEAILAYLARSYDHAGDLLPQDPHRFGQTMQWLGFSATCLASAGKARRIALFGMPGNLHGQTQAARRAFRIMDDHMVLRRIEGAEWFVGNGATLADVALFPAFALSRDFGIDHDEYPALRRWIRRVRTLKGFKTMPGIPDYH